MESSRRVFKGRSGKTSVTIQQEELASFDLDNSPSISIFPQKLTFPQIYPNAISQKKILIPNSGMTQEAFDVSITKGTPFSIPITKLSIDPGQTYATIVTYNPKEIGSHNAMLLFSGNVQLRVPLSGTCVASPLEIPPLSSDQWIFTSKQTERIIKFGNKDLAKSLSVIIATDCQAFTAYPLNFKIGSASSADVTIRYDPSKPVTKNPTLAIQCSQSGDSIIIPLIITEPRPMIVVDFGKSVINQTIRQSISLSSNNEKPIVPQPFYYVDEASDNEMIFEFNSSIAGEFQCVVKLRDIDLQLKGVALDAPFSLNIPQTFPKKPFFIHNNSDSLIHVKISAKGLIFSANSFDIPPNSVQTISAEVNGKTDGKVNVEWESNEGKFNKILSLEPTDETELLETESMLTSGSFQSKQKTKTIIKKQSNTEEDEEEEDKIGNESSSTQEEEEYVPLTTETPFISLDKQTNEFNIAINGTKSFDIQAPEFIKVPSKCRPNSEIPIQILTNENIFCKLKVTNEKEKLEIPIISLNQQSKLVFQNSLLMKQIGTGFTGKLIVKNEGLKPGFITFSSAPNSNVEVSVDPLCAVIKPKSKCSFEFSACEQASIVAFTCDEVVRQMRKVVSPSDFFSTCIEQQVDELKPKEIRVIKMYPKKEILKIAKKNITKTEITLNTKETDEQLITLTPEKLIFAGIESKTANLLNMTSMRQSFSITSSSPFVCIEPLSGVIDPYQSFTLKVSMLKRMDATVTVKCGDTVLTTEVVCTSKETNDIKRSIEQEISDNQQQHYVQKEKKQSRINKDTKPSLLIQQKEDILFPICRPGTLRRAQLKVANKSKHPVIVQANCNIPFSCPVPSFTIEPHSYVLLPVHFAPLSAGKYTDELILQTNNNSVSRINLQGSCYDQ